MADYPISNVPRRIVYTGSAGAGPYAFDFEVLIDTDIAVYKNDVKLTLTTDYTVSISPTLGTGSITLVSAASGSDRITIVGARPVERSSDFTTGGDFFANTLNDELDSQTILVQQIAETAERGIKAPVTDPTTINMTLPVNTARAGKTLAFDASGNPVAGDPIGNWRGNWASGTSYQNRDIIKDTTNSNVYLCTVAHTSSGSLPISTNADSAKWALVVDAAAAGAAQLAAEAAQAAAELAETNAETAETNAETAETNAETAATAAASSASSASSSASTASTAATNAGNSATAAASSASAASTSATNAASSASSASSSASTATTQATNASNSASAAATSATNASNSASAASTSATNASSSASAAATSATNAATSATNASNAQTAAEAARDQTLTAFDNFDDRYLGTKASDPTLDNDGNALIAGALYFNSTDGVMKVYDGTQWLAAYASLSGALIAANNLSDLVSASTARTNLGLGALATKGDGDKGDITVSSSGDTWTIDNNVITPVKMANSGAEFGMRNRIINGAMMIDQRNAGASVTPVAWAYTLDRWQFELSQASKLTVQQNASSVTLPAGFSNYLGVTSSSAYSVGSGESFAIHQYIEGFNFADMAWGTANASPVTLSFKVYSSLTGTFGGSLKNSASNRSYPFSYTISSANTWTSISITIAGDTTGTWIGATNGVGCAVTFGLGVGSTYSGTAGSWAAANYNSATSATSVVGTSGATFYITGVQLEKGSTATSFDYRPYGTELQLCQRYAQVLTGVSIGRVVTNATLGASFVAPVLFRTAPTASNMTYTLSTGSAGTPATFGASVNGLEFFNSSSNWTTTALCQVTATLSAEL